MNNDKWACRFILLAKEYSSWSKDPSTQVGAVAVDPKTRRVLSGGYNGFPRGISDTKERLDNRDIKLQLIVHAESNMIYNATRSGISLEGSYLYVWGLPVCTDCAKAVIQVGIDTVFVAESCLNKKEYWTQSWENTKLLFDEAGVKYQVVSDI